MNKVAKSAIGLMIAMMISKILGLSRELVLASYYGVSGYSDAYLIALNIPNILFEAIGLSIATTFIPLYYENQKIGGEKKAIEFMNNMLNIVIISSLVVSILGCVFAKYLVKVFAIGFEGEILSMAISFTRIIIFGLVFIAIRNIFTPFLQTKNNFFIPGLVGIPFNLIIIVSIILSTKTNSYVLAIGTLVAIASQFILQLPFVLKKGYRYKSYIDVKDEHIKKMIWLVGPVFIGVAVNQINAMVDRTLASTLAVGSISALNYANRLNGFVMGLFITSIGTVIYPILSKLSFDNNK